MPEQLAPNLVADETHHPVNDPLFTPEAWLRATREVFEIVAANRVGQLVVAALARGVEIRPWRNTREINATATPRGGWPAERNAIPRGERVRYCGDVRGTPADETARPVPGVGPGTGRGTRVLVHYTPWYWWGPRGGVRLGRAPGSPYIAWEDEVLLHELVHAAQQTRGADSCVATTHGYDTYTEFCAVTVESMYMSCTPDRPVRNNHHGYRVRMASDPNDVLPPTLRETDESIWLSRFRRLMPDLTNALEALPNPPVRYNPFRAQRIREATALRGRARRRPAAR